MGRRRWDFRQELIKQYKYIKIMSGKSKKTTADKTVYNQKQTKYISHSASKMVNRLSLSFYAENTLKMQKQVIMDAYDDFQTDSPLSREPLKPVSLSKGKLMKPKTPIVRVIKQDYQHQLSTNKPAKICTKPAEPIGQKKSIKSSVRERSSSRSSRGKNGNSVLFNYINNRMEGCVKGWNGLRAGQTRPNATKKL